MAEEVEEKEVEAPAPELPVSWGADKLEVWEKAPDEVKEQILKREQQYNEGLRKNAELAKVSTKVNESYEAHKSFYENNKLGVHDAVDMFGNMMSVLQNGSEKDKLQVLNNLGAYAGLVGKDEKGLSSDDIQRAVASSVESKLSEFEKKQQQRMHSEATAKEIEAFKKTHSYVDHLAKDMGAVFRSSPDVDLEKAYQIALELNPSIKKLVDKESKENKLNANSTLATPDSDGKSDEGDLDIRSLLEAGFNK